MGTIHLYWILIGLYFQCGIVLNTGYLQEHAVEAMGGVKRNATPPPLPVLINIKTTYLFYSPPRCFLRGSRNLWNSNITETTCMIGRKLNTRCWSHSFKVMKRLTWKENKNCANLPVSRRKSCAGTILFLNTTLLPPFPQRKAGCLLHKACPINWRKCSVWVCKHFQPGILQWKRKT
jgi:hypothetical protein